MSYNDDLEAIRKKCADAGWHCTDGNSWSKYPPKSREEREKELEDLKLKIEFWRGAQWMLLSSLGFVFIFLVLSGLIGLIRNHL